uniref:Uncharacterized protein n=1 Tax=Aegilops tauschii subsp. strangulata TaxID=200361 RepID=A0A453CLH5_AEGTS
QNRNSNPNFRRSIAMASPLEYARAVLQARLLQAAEDGDLPLFKRTARALDGGKGRLREAVEGATASNCGARALHVAAVHGRMPLCAYLVEDLQVNVDATDESGETALSYAAVNGIVNIVRYLLDHGANPDKSGPRRCTPLHMAVGQG